MASDTPGLQRGRGVLCPFRTAVRLLCVRLMVIIKLQVLGQSGLAFRPDPATR